MSFDESQLQIGKLIHEVPYQIYHDYGLSLNALRSGHLTHLKKSPAHLQQALKKPQEETEALRLGKLIHSAFENPEKFRDSYVVEPEFIGKTLDGRDSKNSKEAKLQKANWYSDLKPGTIVLTIEEVEMITGMLQAAADHRIAKNLLKHGVREVSGWVKDPGTGLILQFRPDFIQELGYPVDYKSTRDASTEGFGREIFSEYGRFYILMAAHYSYCAKLLGLQKSDSFTFFAIEKTPPYGINIFALGEAQIDVGERWRRKLTKQYADCLASGKWPCYEEKVINPAIPAYVSIPFEDEFYE